VTPSGRGTAAGWPAPFLALWMAQTVSSVGTQLSLVAIPMLAVFALHAGPGEMAVLAALETLPFVILVLPAGVIADAGSRRRLLILSDLGRAAAMATIPVVFAIGVASFALLCAVAILVGGFSAMFVVAQQAYVPELVDEQRLVKANQRLEISDSGARVIGPGAAGFLVQLGGATLAVALDAVSYLASAVAVWFARGGRPVETSRRSEPGIRAIVAGVQHVLREPALRLLVTSTAIFNLAAGMTLAQIVLFATGDIGLTAAGYGLFQGFGNLGFVVGAVVVDRVERRLGAGAVLAIASVFGSLAMVLIAAAGLGFGLPALLAGRFMGAVAAPLYNVVLVSVRQARTPDELRGRVAATFRAVDWGTAPIGAILSGLIGVAFGLEAVMLVAAAIGLLSLPWVLVGTVRHISLGSNEEAFIADVRSASSLESLTAVPASLGPGTP